MADRTNTYIVVMDGDRLVELFLPEHETASQKPPTQLDLELFRIFHEHEKFQAENLKLTKIATFANKLVQCFPVKIEGEEQRFDIPRYVIDELDIALKESE